MNSEELEQSLRSEFETYLNSIFADLRQESAEFQRRIQAEFDRHRTEFDEAFAAISARFDTAPGFNEAFDSSVAEHLKLARDEGAKIAANAMVEAEKYDQQRPTEAAPAKYDAIRDAVDDISTKDSQSAILKSLVQQASEFAPRGAFFIIKSGHFAGWKVFGSNEELEKTVREVHFPVSQDTILSRAIDTRSTVEGSAGEYQQDSSFLDPLDFGAPPRMIALPLVARGRGVAVMYVDRGDSGGEINREALETIMRVAGLTVELLASAQTAAEENRTMAAADFEDARHEKDDSGYRESYEQAHTEPVPEAPAQGAGGGFSFSESVPENVASYSEPRYPEPVADTAPEYEAGFQDSIGEATHEADPHFESTIPNIEIERPAFSQEFGTGTNVSDFRQPSFESAEVEADQPAPEYTFETPEPATEQERTADFSFPESPSFRPPVSEFGQAGMTDFQSPATNFPTADSGFQAPAPEYGQSSTSEVGPSAMTDFQSPATNFPTADSGFQAPAQEYGQQVETQLHSPFEIEQPVEAPSFASSPFDRAVEEYQPAAAAPAAYSPAPEPVVPAPAVSAPHARLSDRPVDLPIEVPESERRLHNDARRFARLLVSEIKLYNEKKVIEGKQANDLYERLKEAIDRSREMYDKRVQPPVASKFDYFHYELLNSLAEGNIDRLGAGYPGAKV